MARNVHSMIVSLKLLWRE